jgi:hypothetical protein
MDDSANTGSPLHRYIEVDEGWYRLYEEYQPKAFKLRQIDYLKPTAHVVVCSRVNCSDSARNIPALTRIAEHLPGWTWEIFDVDTDTPRSARLSVKGVPTIIVYGEKGGDELGRIAENPISGSLGHDLLQIVRQAAAQS